MLQGLLPVPPQRNFACRPVVYLTPSLEFAREWAGEIARETGMTDFAVLSVDINPSSRVCVSTEVAPQITHNALILPLYLHVIETLHNVKPVFNVERLLQRGVAGYRYCVACETNVADDQDSIADHLQDFHEEEEPED